MKPNKKHESHSNLTIAIMAGGKSSRMGTDKSFVPVLGKPMIEHVLTRVNGLGDEIIIMTNKPDQYRYLGLPICGDVYRDHGPLGGLHAALSMATNSTILVVGCDMPWLNRPLLDYLVSQRIGFDAVVPRWTKFPEPMHAVYGKSCLKFVEQNLQAGRLKLVSFYGQVAVRFVDHDEIAQFDPEGLSFANVNTPDDLDLANKQK